MPATLQYLYTQIPGKSESIAVTGAFVRTIASTNPRFKSVKEYLFNTEEADLDASYVLRLIDAGAETLKGINALSERVNVFNGQLYFDGDLLDNALSRHITRMIKDGDDNYLSFVNFLENLAQNPSRKAKRQLFTWLNDRDFTITPDGLFIAYKGVSANGDSIHQGRAFVNGIEINGYINNQVGDVVTMPRSKVDDDTHRACSTGLHAGTHSYAQSYGTKLLMVVINPRDVVSVPKDSGFAKLRVCRYVVIQDASKASPYVETTYSGRHVWNEASTPSAQLQCSVCSFYTEVVDTEGACPACAEDYEEVYDDDSY